MNTPSYPTKELRGYPAVHEFAGKVAESQGVPWWCAFGYAASLEGTTSALAVWHGARCWLRGWLAQWQRERPGAKPPKLITDLLAHEDYAIPCGRPLADVPPPAAPPAAPTQTELS